MKNIIQFAAIALLFTACGSQVVEFPLDGTATPDIPLPCECSDDFQVEEVKFPEADCVPGSTGCPLPCVPGTTGCPDLPDVGLDAAADTANDVTVDQGTGNDSGLPDVCDPTSAIGCPSDSGPPIVDSGTDRDCGNEPSSCDRNHGQCVSACAHTCNKKFKTCSKRNSCFKECKCVCDDALKECKKKQ